MSRISSQPVPQSDPGARGMEGAAQITGVIKPLDISRAELAPANAEQNQWVIDAFRSRDPFRINEIPEYVLRAVVRGNDPIAQGMAIGLITVRGVVEAIPDLAAALDRDVPLKLISQALIKFGRAGEPCVDALARAVDDPRKAADVPLAVEALKAIGGHDAGRQLALLAVSGKSPVRELALAALEGRTDMAAAAIPVLRAAFGETGLDSSHYLALNRVLASLGWSTETNSLINPVEHASLGTEGSRSKRIVDGIRSVVSLAQSTVFGSPPKESPFAPHGIDIGTLGMLRSEIGRPMKFTLTEGKEVSGDYGGVFLRKTGFRSFETVHLVGDSVIPHDDVKNWQLLADAERNSPGYLKRGVEPLGPKHRLRDVFIPPKPPLSKAEYDYLQTQRGREIEIIDVHGNKTFGTFGGVNFPAPHLPMFLLDTTALAGQQNYPSIAKYTFYS